MRVRLFAIGLLFPVMTFAQNGSKPTVPVKPLSADDSVAVKRLFFSALREKTIENYDLAGELFGRCIQIDAGNDAALFELATIKKNKKKESEAAELLERAVTIKPDNEWYWVALADTYQKTNDIDKLDNVYNQLIKLSPDKPDYYLDKANADFLLQKYADALDDYHRLELITGVTEELVLSRQKVYLKQNNTEAAAADLKALIAAEPDQLRYYLFLAELYNSNNMADKAFKVLADAGKLKPENGDLHLALADIYREKEDFKSSYRELLIAFESPQVDVGQKIKILLGYMPKIQDPAVKANALQLSAVLVKAHPADARAQALYGDMLMQNQQYAEAKPVFKKSISLSKENYATFEQLVRIELSENKIDEAIADGEEALTYFPNQAWMHYLLGTAWLQKKQTAKAIEYLKNAADLNADDDTLGAYIYSILGDAYQERKDYAASDAAYQKSLTYNPENAFTLNNYAYYLSLRGERLDQAAQMAVKANKIQPGNASFEDTYAWILFRQKKYAEARVWIEKAIAHSEKNTATLAEHYGDILFYLGDTAAAVQNWQKAQQLGGKSAALQKKISEKKYAE